MAARADFEAELDELFQDDPRGALTALVEVLRHTLPVFNDREVLETYKKQQGVKAQAPVDVSREPINYSPRVAGYWTTIE